MAPIFQKSLGWLERYLFNVEGQPPQGWDASRVTVPVISITEEPFDWSEFRPAQFVGPAGALSTVLIPASESNRVLLCWLSVSATAGGPFPATDTYGVTLQRGGLAYPLGGMNGSTQNVLFLVRGGIAGTLGGLLAKAPCEPVVVPPGWSVTVDQTSVAGGVTTQIRALGIVLPRTTPFPSVF